MPRDHYGIAPFHGATYDMMTSVVQLNNPMSVFHFLVKEEFVWQIHELREAFLANYPKDTWRVKCSRYVDGTIVRKVTHKLKPDVEFTIGYWGENKWDGVDHPEWQRDTYFVYLDVSNVLFMYRIDDENIAYVAPFDVLAFIPKKKFDAHGCFRANRGHHALTHYHVSSGTWLNARFNFATDPELVKEYLTKIPTSIRVVDLRDGRCVHVDKNYELYISDRGIPGDEFMRQCRMMYGCRIEECQRKFSYMKFARENSIRKLSKRFYWSLLELVEAKKAREGRGEHALDAPEGTPGAEMKRLIEEDSIRSVEVNAV